MKLVEIKDRRSLTGLFTDYKWNYLPDSVLDEYLGEALVDNVHDPQVAILTVPGLKLKIIGGNARLPIARTYIKELPYPTLLLFASAGWEKLVRDVHPGKVISMPRYAFTSESLDFEYLRELKSLIPNGYNIQCIDLSLAQKLASEKSGFSEDHMLNFDSPEDFIARGFGFCILEGDEIVSVATTFAVCDKGIEIQINTRSKHQGKGLATVVAAYLILFSLENDLDPNWDAANAKSVGLAEKLGYTSQGQYEMFILLNSRMKAVFGKFALRVFKYFMK
jgi:hypothetical protein